jgi:hypothetical protein
MIVQTMVREATRVTARGVSSYVDNDSGVNLPPSTVDKREVVGWRGKSNGIAPGMWP